MFGHGKILAFHQTSDRFLPGINNLRPGDFFNLLDLIKSWGFAFWNGEGLAGATDNPSILVLTFDDGYQDQFDLLAHLCEDGITPVVFIPTAFIGDSNRWEYSSRFFPVRHLDADQIKSLASLGVRFGSHGVSHRSLTDMSQKMALHELNESKRCIEEIIGNAVTLISFPFGRTNPRINALARECGYEKGLILSQGHRPAGKDDDDFVRTRIPIYGLDDYFSLRAKMIGDSRLEQVKNRIISNLAGGTIITSRKLK